MAYIFIQVIVIAIFLKESHQQQGFTQINQRLNDLEKKIQSLTQKVDLTNEHCKTESDDVCGPCICRDDDRLLKKFYCDCQNLQPKRDCLEFKQYGIKVSGVYKVHQNLLLVIQVYCDQDTDGGGWTVFQRRIDGSVNFYRDWIHYKSGFGQLQNEFWLGLDSIFTLSLSGLYPRGNELRVDIMDAKRIKQHAKYRKFQVGNADTKYAMLVDDYSGTAKDELSVHNKMMFSTYDVDNDKSSSNCAVEHYGAWWFNSCFNVHLNGLFYPGGRMSLWATGIHWGRQNDLSNSLIFTEMKIRRRL